MADLIVETGVGVVNANAYATVDEVDAILEVNIYSLWPTQPDDVKEKLIIWATRLLDERVRWHGHKVHQTAYLAWPRDRVRDKEGYLVPDNIVPPQVKIAVALLCDHLLAGNPEVANSSSNLTKLQVDVILLQFDAKLPVAKYPVEVKLAIESLGWFIGGRNGPKFIIRH